MTLNLLLAKSLNFFGAANWSLGGNNCIVYSLFCIFIIILVIIITIISIISTISISFVVLLNHLYLNPRVLPFVHCSSPSHCRERGGVSERLSRA